MHYGAPSATPDTQPDNTLGLRPTCLLDGVPPIAREQMRITALEHLSLTHSEPIPIFEEAAQSVSRLLAAPICLVSVFDRHNQIFKATMGLSSLGLMNQLAATRELPKNESFGIHVIDSGRLLMLSDVTQHPAFSKNILVQKYGVQAYLGVPLMTSDQCCIGTVEVMDILPRQYTQQDLALLELNARWAMSEYEKQCWLINGKVQQTKVEPQSTTTKTNNLQGRINTLRLDLISQLTQNLQSPLTTITGMAGMLSREIYGPLTEKQQEYANVVLHSSQNLLSLTKEIMELGALNHQADDLLLKPVDIEMLAQQSLHPIESSSKQQDLSFNLTVEPSSRIWILDRHIIKQLLYHLLLGITKAATGGSTIRLHISRKDERLHLATWVSNPWLGEDLPQSVINWARKNNLLPAVSAAEDVYGFESIDDVTPIQPSAPSNEPAANDMWQELGLLLSQQFTNLHGGDITIQGSQTSGYRYIVSLPPFEAD